MKYAFMSIVLCLVVFSSYASDGVDGVFIPPDASKSFDANNLPYSSALLAGAPVYTFSEFESRNEALRENAAQDDQMAEVGAGHPVDIGGVLWGPNNADGTKNIHICGIRSVDAYGLRIQADLSPMAPNEELWIADAQGRAFGPYGAANAVAGGRWLPTVTGDMAYMIYRSDTGGLPPARITGLSHFFRSHAEMKTLACYVDATCEDDQRVVQLSTAVACITRHIPGTYTMVMGTGFLIRASSSGKLDPYFVTANHVIADAEQAKNADVIWDYRSSACDNDDAELSLCTRSDCAELVATDAGLDFTLLRLKSVPVGQFGRAYLGWDSRVPELGEYVVALHHADGKALTICYGSVVGLDKTINIASTGASYAHQIQVGWDDGVTEPGASGGCLLFANSQFRVAGVLSNGTQQQCGADSETNIDYFASFRAFLQSDAGKSLFVGENCDGGNADAAAAKGNLCVVLQPDEVSSAGASWSLDSGPWHASGESVTGIAAGDHVLSFKAVEATASGTGCSGTQTKAWRAPGSQIITVAPGKTTTVTVQYGPLAKSIQASVGASHTGDVLLLALAAVLLARNAQRRTS